jgi:hypothetical protein
MTANTIFEQLAGFGFKDSEIQRAMNITRSNLEKLREGGALLPLDERHAISSYLAFTTTAAKVHSMRTQHKGTL